MNEESTPTPDAGKDPQPDRHVLEYARPLEDGPRKRFLPKNQSFAGMFSVVPAVALAALTVLLIAMRIAGAPGAAAGGVCCLFAPCTLAAIIAGALGLSEETPKGEKRDGTLAKWSLFVTAGCWVVVGILLVLNRFLR